PGHAKITGHLGGWFPGVNEFHRVADLTVGKGSATAAQIFASGSTLGHRIGDPFTLDIQFHLRQRSHHRKHHRPHWRGGIHIPPPRLSTRNPAPRSRSCWANVSMLWVDRPNRSNVAITNVSPDWSAARA